MKDINKKKNNEDDDIDVSRFQVMGKYTYKHNQKQN